MVTLELLRERVAGGASLGRVRLGERAGESGVDRVTLVDTQVAGDVAALVQVMPNSA